MSEKTQNYKTHRRIVPGHHFLSYLLATSILVGGIVYSFCQCPENVIPGIFFSGIGASLILIATYSRSFALKAQDRAIRAEENFRHYVLTGKPLDSKLRVSQIVALRFASDAEFPALALKAAAENLKNDEIKKLITNWRADHHRV
jgi:hypothetical protein